MAVDVGSGLAPADVNGILEFRESGDGIVTARDHQDLGVSLGKLHSLGTLNHFHSLNLEDVDPRESDDRHNPDISQLPFGRERRLSAHHSARTDPRSFAFKLCAERVIQFHRCPSDCLESRARMVDSTICSSPVGSVASSCSSGAIPAPASNEICPRRPNRRSGSTGTCDVSLIDAWRVTVLGRYELAPGNIRCGPGPTASFPTVGGVR